MKTLWNKYSYVMILIVISFAGAILLSTVFPVSTEDFLTITVSEGDTLWGLAEEYDDYHRLSKHDFIKWVEQYNGVTTSTIYEGEQLIIPVKNSALQQNEFSNLASN